ncbi:MAG: hypothetical protein R3Y44_07715 [Rikenellaceae bacterium]
MMEVKEGEIGDRKLLNITGCSLIFNLPLDICKSDILDEYYLKNALVDKDPKRQKYTRRELCFENKREFVEKHIRPHFGCAEPKIPCGRSKINDNYNSRFACKCLSLASKFMDDNNASDEIVQFYLGTTKISYSCCDALQKSTFDIRTLLHIKRIDKKSYNSYLLFEINLDAPIEDDIVFTKHLFYKKTTDVRYRRLR